jgi:hypothetical protein
VNAIESETTLIDVIVRDGLKTRGEEGCFFFSKAGQKTMNRKAFRSRSSKVGMIGLNGGGDGVGGKKG